MMNRLFVFLCLMILSFPALAEGRNVTPNAPDLNAFSKWPVLHEGRVKPMESFARSVLYDVSGKTSVGDVSAIVWLVNSLFDPASTISKPFIKVEKNSLLGLPKRKGGLYSMNEVMTALNPHQDLIQNLEEKNPAELSLEHQQLLTVYTSVSIYNQVIQSFSAALPLKGYDVSFAGGGGTLAQRELILAGGMGNGLLKFIPSDNPSMPYVSLWQAFDFDLGGEVKQKIQSMAIAWNAQNYKRWDMIAGEVMDALQVQENHSTAFYLEHLYVTWHPILWVIALYGFAVFCMVLPYRKMHNVGRGLALVGFTAHVMSLIMRSIILTRPPTGTLYETLLFGGAIVAMVGIFIGYKSPQKTFFTIMCLVATLVLLFVSRGFIQGDSLNVLVAVLNTNFWLSTHVTCIIIGYGFCILAALCAHGALINDKGQAAQLMIPMSLFALLFTSVGTLLGGIWADQSWGRFWGWDPKENGALLIVLWLIWALHGRLSGHLKGARFAAALAATNIMVALTWFGVNLLGVGLHSYGFISGIAYGLGGFVTVQSLVIIGLYYFDKKKIRRQNG